jgi:hypothetical protein
LFVASCCAFVYLNRASATAMPRATETRVAKSPDA